MHSFLGAPFITPTINFLFWFLFFIFFCIAMDCPYQISQTLTFLSIFCAPLPMVFYPHFQKQNKTNQNHLPFLPLVLLHVQTNAKACWWAVYELIHSSSPQAYAMGVKGD